MKLDNKQSKQIEMPERAAWQVREFCETLRISRSTFWKYSALGKIKTIRIGGRVLVPAIEAHRITTEGLK